jgi:glycosyltransferase involved in cell wall biosynthesis
LPARSSKSSTAVLGVVFAAAQKYLPDYFNSLRNQTFKDFDLIILNDGIEDFKCPQDLNVIEIPCSGSPASIRERGINHALDEGYGRLVFTDTDDFFADNRIERSMELLDDNDIVVNDITLVSEDGTPFDERYISRRLRDLHEIDIDILEDKNIMGLSNTALNLGCLDGPVRFDSSLIAVDWFFFSVLLIKGRRAVFTNSTLTFYRQHGENAVGLGEQPGRMRVLRALGVKALHYRLLAKESGKFMALADEFEELKKEVENSDNIEAYREEMLARAVDEPFWWENIRLRRPESK